MITDYLEQLVRGLDFDRSLARCVRQEVEDHLWEAVAADPTGNTPQAQRRAIANFGDARAIAAQFAVVSLARHTRRAAVAVVLVIAGDLIAMKARITWYAAAQRDIPDDMIAFHRLVISIDRYAFWMSVIIGLGALVYIHSREIPTSFYPAYRRQIRCFSLMCRATAAALVVSVLSDGLLTTLQLRGMELSLEIWVAIFTMAIEITCVGIVLLHIRSMTLRSAATAALVKT